MDQATFDENVGKRLTHLFFVIDRLIRQIREEEIRLYPETKLYTDTKDIELPCIAYKIIDRSFPEDITGRKPMFKNRNFSNNTETKGQMFDSVVEFSVISQSYHELNEEREWFEEFMIEYLDVFKNNGMLQVLFSKQGEDSYFEIKDNYFIKQPLYYHIRNERNFDISFDNIKDINLKISLQDDVTNY